MSDPNLDAILYRYSAWHYNYRMCYRSNQLFKRMATSSDSNGCLLWASTSWNGRLHEGQSSINWPIMAIADLFIDEPFHSNQQRSGFDIGSELDGYYFWMAWISFWCWRLLLSLDTTAIWVTRTKSYCWYDWALQETRNRGTGKFACPRGRVVWKPIMTLIAQLKMKKTILIEKSWWWPFSKCSTKPNENFCEHKMTEMEIIRNCSCSYGLEINKLVSDISYSAYDMHIIWTIWYGPNITSIWSLSKTALSRDW